MYPLKNGHHRMNAWAKPVEDAADMSLVFAGKTVRKSGQESADIILSWQGVAILGKSRCGRLGGSAAKRAAFFPGYHRDFRTPLVASRKSIVLGVEGSG